MKTKTLWVVNAILAVLLAGGLSIARAEGDKDRTGNIVFCDDGEPCGIVVPVDCTKEFSPQSGASVYFCIPDEDE